MQTFAEVSSSGTELSLEPSGTSLTWEAVIPNTDAPQSPDSAGIVTDQGDRIVDDQGNRIIFW